MLNTMPINAREKVHSGLQPSWASLGVACLVLLGLLMGAIWFGVTAAKGLLRSSDGALLFAVVATFLIAVCAIGCWLIYVQLATRFSRAGVEQPQFPFGSRRLLWSEIDEVLLIAPVRLLLESPRGRIVLYLGFYRDSQSLLDAIHDLIAKAQDEGQSKH